MKKKKLSILVTVFVSLAMVAISVMGIVSELFNPYIWYSVYSNVDKDYDGKGIINAFTLINSPDDLKETDDWGNNLIYLKDKYALDDLFFANKSLIVFLGSVNDKSNYSIENIYIEDGILIVDIHYINKIIYGDTVQIYPEYRAEILIEVKKSDIKEVKEVQKIITKTDIYITNTEYTEPEKRFHSLYVWINEEYKDQYLAKEITIDDFKWDNIERIWYENWRDDWHDYEDFWEFGSIEVFLKEDSEQDIADAIEHIGALDFVSKVDTSYVAPMF